MRDFEEAFNLNRKSHYALNKIGYCLRKLGRYKESLEKINMAIDLERDIAHYWFNRGVTKCRLLTINEAIQDFREALKLYPRNEKYEDELEEFYNQDCLYFEDKLDSVFPPSRTKRYHGFLGPAIRYFGEKKF